VPEGKGTPLAPSRFRDTWTGVLRVAAPFLGLAAGASLLVPPHTHEAKANELALFYGFSGWWLSGFLLSRRSSRTTWVLFSVVAFALLLPRMLGNAPTDIGPSYTPPWPAYPLSVRWIQLAVAAGVGLAGLVSARLLLATTERVGPVHAAKQLRRRPVFLYAASGVALALSALRVVSATALFLLIWYSAAWAVMPAVLRLLETRPARLAVITVASIAGVVGGAAFEGHFLRRPGGPFLPSGLIIWFALISLAAVALAGVAVWGSELLIKGADRFGGLKTRLLAFGCVIVALIGGEPTELVQALVWPLTIQPSAVPGEAKFSFSFTLPMIVVVMVALTRRFSRDLGFARLRFRAIAAGQLPSLGAAPSREESGRLLERITHLSTQLTKRHFLEELNVELRARAEQLRSTTGQLNDTNALRLEAERFAAISGIAATVTHELGEPISQITGSLSLIRSHVEIAARCLRDFRHDGTAAAHLLAQTAQQLSASGRDVENNARRAALVVGDLNSQLEVHGTENAETCVDVHDPQTEQSGA
jgi:hypothetical protein